MSSLSVEGASQVYRKCAEEHETNGSNENSIEFWTKSLEAAKAAEEKADLGQACYRLGKAYTELGNPTRYTHASVVLVGLPAEG